VILADLPPLFFRILALVLGLVWGSFLNVVIYRIPRGMSLSRPASHCPSCKQAIAPYRNIPLFSWVWQRGRAACCGVKIPPRYLMVELIGGVLSLAVMVAAVLTLPGATSIGFAMAVYVSYLALALGLTAAVFIDLSHMIIPDRISLGGTVLGIATFSLRGMSIDESLLGAAVGFAVVWLPFGVIYPLLRGQVGMGMGDAKLTMLAGAWFGWTGALFVLAAGAIQGSVITLLMIASGQTLDEPEAVKREREELRAELETLPEAERAALEKELGRDPLAEEPSEGLGMARIAFGPFLILAILECLLIGPERLFRLLLG
jgi:leader peptidase (prepilin peptidase)/N-methyltransferase